MNMNPAPFSKIPLFNMTGRIGTDPCSIDQRAIQNSNISNYQMENYSGIGIPQLSQEFATNQPGIIYTSYGINANNVEASSKMTVQTPLTKDKGGLSLMTRSYLTVPFLGRGSVDPILETQIRNGQTSTSRNSITGFGGVSYMKYLVDPVLMRKGQTKVQSVMDEIGQNSRE
jgi:hypothetical protein